MYGYDHQEELAGTENGYPVHDHDAPLQNLWLDLLRIR